MIGSAGLQDVPEIDETTPKGAFRPFDPFT